MQSWLLLLASAALAASGFFLQRWLRRDRIAETIDRRLKVITLQQKLNETGIDARELPKIEEMLSAKQVGARNARPKRLWVDQN